MCFWRVRSLLTVVLLKWVLKMGVSLSLKMFIICLRFDSCTALAYSFSLSAAKISSNLLEIERVLVSYNSATTATVGFSSLLSFFTAFFFSFFSCLIVGSSSPSGFILGLRFFLAGYSAGFTSSSFDFSFSFSFSFSQMRMGISTFSMILVGSEGETDLTLETGLDTFCRLPVLSSCIGRVAVTNLLPTLLGQQPAIASVPNCCSWRAESWRWAGNTCELQFCEQLKQPAWQGGVAVKCWDGAYSAAMGQGCGWAAQMGGAQRGGSWENL